MSKQFLKFEQIQLNSIWKPCDGANGFVTVIAKEGKSVYYTHSADKDTIMYDKDTFSFQVRYYLHQE